MPINSVGKLIEAHSFYEDKFIGDLANLRNIKPTLHRLNLPIGAREK